MEFEKVYWHWAFWPPFNVIQIGYVVCISILFMTLSYRIDDSYGDTYVDNWDYNMGQEEG